MKKIEKNIEKINSFIEDKNITLVAVSKNKSDDEILCAYNFGLRDFGENYVQELVEKMEILPSDIRWHMIGHLQKNKVKYVVDERIVLIHSVDSISLVKEINKWAVKKNLVVNILLEVNVSFEKSKYGFKYDEVVDIIDQIKNFKNVKVLGLMTILPNINDQNILSSYFRKLHKLAKKLNLKELSMGMTNDYDIAIKEGSTIIRIGTGIFGFRK